MASLVAASCGEKLHNYVGLNHMTGEALGSTSADEESSDDNSVADEQLIDYTDLEVLYTDRHQQVQRRTPVMPADRQQRSTNQ